MPESANPHLSYMAPSSSFKFGLDVKEGLLIEWSSDVPVAGLPVPMGLLIPVEHARALRAFLVANNDTQEMLAAAPPTQSKH
jgi:hypothetical protein